MYSSVYTYAYVIIPFYEKRYDRTQYPGVKEIYCTECLRIIPLFKKDIRREHYPGVPAEVGKMRLK